MISTKKWIIIIFIFSFLLVGICLLLQDNTKTHIAEVKKDGAVIKIIDLKSQKEKYTFTVEGEACTNVIEVNKGKVRVLEADCPDQVCVKHGWLESSTKPIVCLPNKLVINFKNNESSFVDSVSE